MQRLIVGISGATGAIYGIRTLQMLRDIDDVEVHLVMTSAARLTIMAETDYSIRQVQALANVVHDIGDVGATIASGSFRTLGMIVAPCSMRTFVGNRELGFRQLAGPRGGCGPEGAPPIGAPAA